MGLTKIEWVDKSWNPISGCSKISPGCQNCYAERMAKRLVGRCGYPKDRPFEVTLHSEHLDDPLKWKKPSRIFVCSMGDLFHEDVPFDWVDEVMARIGFAKHHTCILLTKRPERMKKYFTVSREAHGCCGPWPWPHVWLMTTAENQEMADLRLPFLLQIPGVMHGVSVEPALGFVDFGKVICNDGDHLGPSLFNHGHGCGLDWVICGGETGPYARPMHPDIPRKLRDDCQAAGVPFFFKSWGEWAPGSDARKKTLCVYNDGRTVEFTKEAIVREEFRSGIEHKNCNPVLMSRVGKKAAGRLLDGKEWNELPKL